MSRPQIQGFAIDDRVVDKLWTHGLTAGQVLQILEDTFVVVRNRRDRRGLYLVIGHDRSGLIISAPVTTTATRGIWQVLTAWPAKQSEQAIYKGRVR